MCLSGSSFRYNQTTDRRKVYPYRRSSRFITFVVCHSTDMKGPSCLSKALSNTSLNVSSSYTIVHKPPHSYCGFHSMNLLRDWRPNRRSLRHYTICDIPSDMAGCLVMYRFYTVNVIPNFLANWVETLTGCQTARIPNS